jgi:hypothetical protein
VAGGDGQAASVRPPPVPVHDDRDALGDIERFEVACDLKPP